jgi:glucosamine--fructose-6-phosphate aminotransferase (isomerizing)
VQALSERHFSDAPIVTFKLNPWQPRQELHLDEIGSGVRMTFFLQDILRQPGELQKTIDYLCGTGDNALQSAAAAIRTAQNLYITGMGSSWHAALLAGTICHRSGYLAHTFDASDLLEFHGLPSNAVVVIISRSGRSVELAPLLKMARKSGATVIGITNNQDGPLAQHTDISIVVPTQPDHAISVNTYSNLSLAAGAMASVAAAGSFGATRTALSRAIADTSQVLGQWQQQIAETRWLVPRKSFYFLARRSSFGNAQEARLMWEEGAKTPATAMGTGSFRHGPQEIITPDMRFCMWIDNHWMRDEDLAVARDFMQLGAKVMLIGQDLPPDLATLTIQLPKIPPHWQFLIDVIPAQLAAEHLSRISGVDCDAFRFCSYVVEDEYGLLNERSTTLDNG